MLPKEPSHGYELRARLARALGPVAEGISEAQMYVTLTRLEKGGFVERLDAPAQRAGRKVYCLTSGGQEGGGGGGREPPAPRPPRVPNEAHRRRAGRPRRPGQPHRRAASRPAAPPARSGPRGAGRGKRFRRSPAPRRHRPSPASRPALVASLRDVLDETEYPEMNDS